MKQIYICILLMFSVTLSAQNAKKVTAPAPATKTEVKEQLDSFKIKVDSLLTRIDSLLQRNNELLRQQDVKQTFKQQFKLYPTENLYNFLLLDTMTGQIKQVQWSLDKDKEFTVSLNSKELDSGLGQLYGPGIFELYPTKNMYQFILLNKLTGARWHVQWGLEDSKRWIRSIW